MYNHIDEIRSKNLAEKADYEKSNNKGCRNIIDVFDFFSKYIWFIPSDKNNGQTITDELSRKIKTSKRKPIKLESGRGKALYNIIFQNFLKVNKKHHY